MTRLARQDSHVGKLASALDQALALLREFPVDGPTATHPVESPETLLDQCVDMVTEHSEMPQEPIRTVHHMACTGGTLITKCLAAMPNTQVISEVDPLSDIGHRDPGPKFAPTDMIQLMRQSTRGADAALLVDMFLANLDLIQAAAVARGQRLILRDHSHSHFCVGTSIPDRPAFLSIVSSRFPVRSIVTVRDPIDSFLSLLANRRAHGGGWIHFDPPTFEEYCRRYQAFLDAHSNLPIIKYELFVTSPTDVMRQMCDALDLAFNEHFEEVFNLFSITGDSGRKSDVIGSRGRRAEDEEEVERLLVTPGCAELRQRLGYR